MSPILTRHHYFIDLQNQPHGLGGHFGGGNGDQKRLNDALGVHIANAPLLHVAAVVPKENDRNGRAGILNLREKRSHNVKTNIPGERGEESYDSQAN